MFACHNTIKTTYHSTADCARVLRSHWWGKCACVCALPHWWSQAEPTPRRAPAHSHLWDTENIRTSHQPLHNTHTHAQTHRDTQKQNHTHTHRTTETSRNSPTYFSMMLFGSCPLSIMTTLQNSSVCNRMAYHKYGTCRQNRTNARTW